MTIIDQEENCSIQYYDCFTTLANIEVSAENLDLWHSLIRSRPESENSRWYGTKNISELRNFVELYGWEEGAKKGLQLLGDIKAPSLPSIKRKRSRGATGHTINMTSVFNGNLDKAWSTTKKVTNSGRKKATGNVNIVIDIAANCNNSAEKFFWRGTVGCVLARALQKSGRNVAIYVCARAHRCAFDYDLPGREYVQTLIKIKEYGMPLAIDFLFASSALAGFFRYYVFKSWCALPYAVESGLGRSKTPETKLLSKFLDDKPVLLIHNIWDAEQAKEAVERLLEQFK